MMWSFAELCLALFFLIVIILVSLWKCKKSFANRVNGTQANTIWQAADTAGIFHSCIEHRETTKFMTRDDFIGFKNGHDGLSFQEAEAAWTRTNKIFKDGLTFGLAHVEFTTFRRNLTYED